MTTIRVCLPYVGGELSKNRSHTRAGYLKAGPRKWCEGLAMQLRVNMNAQGIYALQTPLSITVSGQFQGKPPDIHNLFPLIADCIQGVVGINDQHFRMHTGWVDRGEPMIFVEITDTIHILEQNAFDEDAAAQAQPAPNTGAPGML